METTSSTSTTSSPGKFRWAVAFAAIAGMVPYVVLKLLWISGSRIGIVDPDFGRGATMALLNAATAVMDVIAVTLALSFVTGWGRRVPAPVILLPMWVATGLLGQILLVLPVQLVVGTESSAEGKGAAVLAEWVPTVVYSGFAWQGFFLILGFALYANDRWGAQVRASSPFGLRAVDVLAVVGACAVAVSSLALRGPGRLETINAVASSAIALCAGAAVIAFGSRRAHRSATTRSTTAGIGWFASGAMFAWGSYLTLVAVTPNDLRGFGGIDVAGAAQTALTAAIGALCGFVLLRSVTGRRAVTGRPAVPER